MRFALTAALLGIATLVVPIAALHACITDAVRTWAFPVDGNHTVYTIAHPYLFEPGA